MRKWFCALGGGIGDCLFHCTRNREFFYLPHLVRDLHHKVRVISQCHCDAIEDLFRHNPYVHEHIMEPWNLPSREETLRLNNPIDGYLPLHNPAFIQRYLGYEIPMERPQIWLSPEERAQLALLCRDHPLIVMQPFAGLSDRDGFDPEAIDRTVNALVARNVGVKIVIVGKNHERGFKYAREEVLERTARHPNVINMIDRLGIRMSYHLVMNCDAFIGCHSNLIRTAWEGRKRNVCVMPDPLMINHLPNLDSKYTFGFEYPETKIVTYPFAGGEPQERRFELLDTDAIANWALGIS